MPAESVENKERLWAILARLSGRQPGDITAGMPIFGAGLALDSLSGVDLLTSLEAEFGITLDDIDLHMEALDNVGRLWELVQQAPARDWAKLLQSVAIASRLKEGAAGVERALYAIRSQPGAMSRQLAAACALPTPTVSALRKELARAGLAQGAGKGAYLTELGQSITDKLFPPFMPALGQPSAAYGRFATYPLFEELVAALTELMQERPSADTSIDQAKCLPQTVAARALLALEYGALAGRSVAFIGDDDFTSIGLGVLGKLLQARGAWRPVRLTVLDIDERITAVITAMAERLALPITAYRHDLRQPLPAHIYREHDAFFTDPPYTTSGARLFVERGISICKNAGCAVFFSFAPKGPADMLAVQQELAGMGLLIREVLAGFNRYEGASLWGNSSQMFVYEGVAATQAAMPASTALAGPAGTYAGPLYTADFRAPHG